MIPATSPPRVWRRLIPIAVLALRVTQVSPEKLLSAAFNPQAIAAYEFSIWSSLVAAAINLVFGSLMAWTLVRYSFPGQRLLEGLIDFPFGTIHLQGFFLWLKNAS